MNTPHSNKNSPNDIQFIFDSEWIFLEDYLDRIELFLRDEREFFDNWAIGQTEALSPEQQEEFYFKEVETYLLNEKFPKFLRNSFFVSSYSLWEYHISIICKLFKEKQQIAICVSDMHGTLLKRTQLFWKLAKQIFPCDSNSCDDLENYSSVRHCIVHSNSSIKQNNKHLFDYANRKNLVSIENDITRLVLSKEFCKESLRTMKDFVITLYQSV